MKISECAELCGVTVRTIRHYHHIGLVPVPSTRGGRRNYEFAHVARILRIRWLVDAGLGLDQVAHVLVQDPTSDPPSTSAQRDLRETAATLDARIAHLQEQRRRVGELLELAETDQPLGVLPPALQRFYDEAAARLEDPDAVAALRRDQDLAEMFTQRGLMPRMRSLEPLMAGLSDHDLDRVADFYTVYARIPRSSPEEARAHGDQLRALVHTWVGQEPRLTAQMVELIPRWARSGPGLRLMESMLTLATDDPHQKRLLRQVLHDVLATDASANPSQENTP